LTRKPLLLLGAGGHARACIDVVEQQGEYHIVGLLGLPDEVGRSVLGYPVLGVDADLASFASQAGSALITIGQIKTPQPRIDLFLALERNGFALPTVVSPRGYVSPHARVGAGTIVMHGAVVNAGAVVGRNCIINSQALVEHDCTVGDHCHVATSAALNSGVRVGDGTFIGSGSAVRQGVTIGARCVIGMGQRVLVDCADGAWLPERKVTA
jgi:sugar O-acyltransferase (sialic acid O-acetyltransferase NeuD family)